MSAKERPTAQERAFACLGLLTLEFKPPRPADPLKSLVFAEPLSDLLTGVLLSPVPLANGGKALATVVKATTFPFSESFRGADLDKRVTWEPRRTSSRVHLNLVLSRTLVTGVALRHVVQRRRGLPRMPVFTVPPLMEASLRPESSLGNPSLQRGQLQSRLGAGRKGEVGIAEIFSALVKINDLGSSAWASFPVLVFVGHDRTVLPRSAPATVRGRALPRRGLVLLRSLSLTPLTGTQGFLLSSFGRGSTLTPLLRSKPEWRLSGGVVEFSKPMQRRERVRK